MLSSQEQYSFPGWNLSSSEGHWETPLSQQLWPLEWFPHVLKCNRRDETSPWLEISFASPKFSCWDTAVPGFQGWLCPPQDSAVTASWCLCTQAALTASPATALKLQLQNRHKNLCLIHRDGNSWSCVLITQQA